MVYRERINGQKVQGEVRYLLKDMLGKNCGDHRGREKKDRKSEDRGRDGGGKECRKARMEARQGIQRLDEGLADIQARLGEMNMKQGAGGVSTQGLAGDLRMQYPGGVAADQAQMPWDSRVQPQMANEPSLYPGVMNPELAAVGGRHMAGLGPMGIGRMGRDPAAGYDPLMELYNVDPDDMRAHMGPGLRRAMIGAPRLSRKASRGRPRRGMDTFDDHGPLHGRGGRRSYRGPRHRHAAFEDQMSEDLMRRRGDGGGDFGDRDPDWETELNGKLTAQCPSFEDCHC